uniref:Mannan-binding C-type lectin n=1 Tax=Stichopus japonicus TaxID=307972 RepID=Q1WDP2_STIJA|nr:mannan-binding C-type lectin [Apostichopus japonicus]
MYRTVFLLVATCMLFVHSSGCTLTACPSKWTGFNGKCYRLFAAEHKQFDAAEIACQSAKLVDCQGNVLASGHLASVHSQEEQNFLFEMFRSTLHHTSSWNPQVYIGMKVGSQSNLQSWTDGSSVDYTSWFSGEPNNGPNSRGAIASGLHASGQWADAYVNSKSNFPYICQLPCTVYQFN